MKKYLYIYKSEVMTSLGYTFDTIIGFIGYVIMIFIFLNLWNYIYSDPSELINGFSMSDMIWYVIVTEILWSSMGARKLCKNIANDVKSGNITYNLNKPYSYIQYILYNHLGHITVKFILITILGMILGLIFLGTFPNLNILSFLAVILSCILATIVNILLTSCIGLLSFYIEDSNPIFWMYSKMILVFGTIFPVEFFPKTIQKFLNFSPVYAINYAPAKLFVKFSPELFINVLVIQIIYILIGALLAHFIYKKGVRKLNVNGG